MSITIHIPTPLRPFVDNQSSISVDQEGTIQEIILRLIEVYPDLEKNILDTNKKFRKFINLYVNDEDIRYLNGPDTYVKEGASVSIIPSIAGGCNG